MNRRQFIEAQGATCKNWTWSWAFVNHKDKVVIFGAWDKYTDGENALIFGEAWKRNSRGHKPAAYEEAREYIRLVEEEGYTLKTFPIEFSAALKDEKGIGPGKIKGFSPVLTKMHLVRAQGWYAVKRKPEKSSARNKHLGTKEFGLVFAELVTAARYRGTVTYQELAKLIGLPLTGAYMAGVLGDLLGAISEDEVNHGRPMLSVIAIGVKGVPGRGFYPWAQRLGRFDGNDKEAFLEAEMNSVYEAWKVILKK